MCILCEARYFTVITQAFLTLVAFLDKNGYKEHLSDEAKNISESIKDVKLFYKLILKVMKDLVDKIDNDMLYLAYEYVSFLDRNIKEVKIDKKLLDRLYKKIKKYDEYEQIEIIAYLLINEANYYHAYKLSGMKEVENEHLGYIG